MTKKTKVVIYMGKEFTVPTWSKFIAADFDGLVIAYEKEPRWFSGCYRSGDLWELVGHIEREQPPCTPL